jgi:hypothetical protein
MLGGAGEGDSAHLGKRAGQLGAQALEGFAEVLGRPIGEMGGPWSRQERRLRRRSFNLDGPDLEHSHVQAFDAGSARSIIPLVESQDALLVVLERQLGLVGLPNRPGLGSGPGSVGLVQIAAAVLRELAEAGQVVKHHAAIAESEQLTLAHLT